MVANNVSREIATTPCPSCVICGGDGTIIYSGLADRLFGAPGEWQIRRCDSRGCGTLWLDPMPRLDEIGKAYESYYTHDADPGRIPERRLISLCRAVLRLVFSVAKTTLGIRPALRRLNVMYLNRLPPGRVLEVGCGSGTLLAKLRSQGWDVEGQDVDPQAVEEARSRFGLTVHAGELTQLSLSAGQYDVVLLRHVLEHVHDPRALLGECRRLLRPGGRLVAVTPNAASFGHRVFRQDWMPLDPPRHLHGFTPDGLGKVADDVGFSEIRVSSSAADAFTPLAGSLALRWSGRRDAQQRLPLTIFAAAMTLQVAEWVLRLVQRDAGEVCVLQAQTEKNAQRQESS